MTTIDHAAEAQRWLAEGVSDRVSESAAGYEASALMTARAQVHATLAVADAIRAASRPRDVSIEARLRVEGLIEVHRRRFADHMRTGTELPLVRETADEIFRVLGIGGGDE